ncbi:aminotransferase class I/II-fold pyridoxal phosphate-dependent enzyme [Pseudodesulfovibrio senegalensis]|uniref:Aminotransferase class I/II-fold pyridoxal phosphate-dependent enzyme n=2 Tax=Pseudodesulfovibrio senegalensis TaxID=1721087 RepID=A0A6N6N2H9_9BACT|nr:aminotransferase class I/II-fold pyridoxal phosphate-dependent enzyme [Pseudodesulfovibrio senegalensis]
MGGSELEQVHAVFDSNYIAPAGPHIERFEQRMAEYTGFGHCVALSSGTAAIHLGLRLLGVRPGDLVIASTLTFIASVSPALWLGAEPLFVDSCEQTWTMDPALLERALEQAHRDGRRVGAVVPTDIYGQCADYDRIQDVCQRFGVPLLTDAAEALGARYGERSAGKGAQVAAFSFNGNKIITCSGGGMLATDNRELAEHARKLSQQAREPFVHYEHVEMGYNYRMSNVCAGIGLGQMDVLHERVAQRREIFSLYSQLLGRVSGISFMPEAAYGRASRWLTVMLLDPERCAASPEQVRLALEAENIESRPVWKPMHCQPVFAGARCEGGAVAESLFARGLCLPSGTAMTRADVERVAGIIRECSA